METITKEKLSPEDERNSPEKRRKALNGKMEREKKWKYMILKNKFFRPVREFPRLTLQVLHVNSVPLSRVFLKVRTRCSPYFILPFPLIFLDTPTAEHHRLVTLLSAVLSRVSKVCIGWAQETRKFDYSSELYPFEVFDESIRTWLTSDPSFIRWHCYRSCLYGQDALLAPSFVRFQTR